MWRLLQSLQGGDFACCLMSCLLYCVAEVTGSTCIAETCIRCCCVTQRIERKKHSVRATFRQHIVTISPSCKCHPTQYCGRNTQDCTTQLPQRRQSVNSSVLRKTGLQAIHGRLVVQKSLCHFEGNFPFSLQAICKDTPSPLLRPTGMRFKQCKDDHKTRKTLWLRSQAVM